MTRAIIKAAIAAVVVVAAFAGWRYLGGPSGTGVTFAQALRPILDANTAVMDIVVGTAEEDTPVMHDMIKGSRIRRTYSNLPGVVSVIDLESWRSLTLTEAGKRAVYTDLKGLSSMPNYLGELRQGMRRLQSDTRGLVEDLGTKEIDGRAAVGFRARQGEFELTLWADPQTGAPLRIEQRAGSMRTTMTNLQFDVPMEDSLFSMEVPEGYKAQQAQLDLTSATEADFIEGLRVLAEFVGDGHFPDSVAVEDFLKLVPAIREKRERLSFSDEQRAAQALTLQKYVAFLAFFKGQSQWHYRGQGVRLDRAETPIFWYQPQGSATWRVIYADLSVRDVRPEDLPE